MKKIYFLLLALCLFSTAKSQIITFPDANFKAKLLEASPSNFIARNQSNDHIAIDVNSNGEIEISEALNVAFLDVSTSAISSLVGIETFTNLWALNCDNNDLISLDVTSLVNLRELDVDSNELTTINVSNNILLQFLECSFNNLTSLDVSPLNDLASLECRANSLINLDVSNNHHLITLICCDNNLVHLNIKNSQSNHGAYIPFTNLELFFQGNPDLQYICADEQELQVVTNYISDYGYTNCHVNTYCSFVPGGEFYTIQGNNKYDNNSNGCDVSDLGYPNLRFNITDGTSSGGFISNASGNYSIAVHAGSHTITPIFENPTYFTISPSNVNVTFPTQASPFTQDFCVTANGTHPDLEVVTVPIGPTRPGFDTMYKIIYKNKGTNTQSGTANLTFNDAVLDFVSANPATSNQTVNNLSWDFTNLQPFETREITVTLNVNSPTETPAVNGGDVLNYTATITSAATDETPTDNTFALNQTVVNSYDPNDKTCLEGATIAPGEVGKYVHYMIRFENNGTANAQNIVVKDMIDTNKFDINSLVPIKGSHSFVTNITAGNKVEFIFENINLPFDNANNDGYVAFKIKTKPTLVVGNTFSNNASIYFDYNFPIVTNTAVTTIQTLSNQDFSFSSYFMLYPNPVKDVLIIETKQTIEVSSINIYNQLGQLVLVVPNAQNISKVDVSNLASGNYFIKINSDKGTSNTKFIKQ